MAGSIDITTQGITSAFGVEVGVTPAKPRQEPKQEPKRAETETPSFSREAVSEVSDALNAAAAVVNRKLSFSVDDETGRIVIKVTNSDTGELIRVIPPEDLTSSGASLGSLVGLLFNDKS